jgi:NADH-quinone oxidoreductase subunit M
MVTVWLLVITAAGGGLAWAVGYWSRTAARATALAALAGDAALLCSLWAQYPHGQDTGTGGRWLAEVMVHWIEPFNINFHLAIDGLSLLLLSLTVFLGAVAIVASWHEVRRRVGMFHCVLLLNLAAVMAVFTALDLFLFYFCWELMLVPMYFLIRVWGERHRVRGALQFFIFTQAGGLLMLLSILGLYYLHGRDTGNYTFDYTGLLGFLAPQPFTFWLMMGFFAAFMVKLPAFGAHAWLPDAYTAAPTAGSIVVAGLMSKTAAYGLLRFALPLFPAASANLSLAAMILGIAGILYGAAVAFAQADVKRLVAYTSLSHLGFVLVGIYAGTRIALEGVVVILLAHGLSVSGLFFAVRALQDRFGTRWIEELGGHWRSTPRLGAVTLFLALASLGLPGLANFIGEFLVLTGTFAVNRPVAIVAAVGFILSPIYALWLIFRLFQGPEREPARRVDLGARELVAFGALVGAIVWMGLYPQPVLTAARPALDRIENAISAGRPVSQGDSGEIRYEPASVGELPETRLAGVAESPGVHAGLVVAPGNNGVWGAEPESRDRSLRVASPEAREDCRTLDRVASTPAPASTGELHD